MLVWITAVMMAGAYAKGEHEMDRIQVMTNTRAKILGSTASSALARTDPELAAIQDCLIFGEIADSGTLTKIPVPFLIQNL